MSEIDEFFEKINKNPPPRIPKSHGQARGFVVGKMCWLCWQNLKTWVHWRRKPGAIKQHYCDRCFKSLNHSGHWSGPDTYEHSWQRKN